MPNPLASASVDLVRAFLASHELLYDVIEKSRSGVLRWEEVERLVGDDESSLLFRLKERSHHLVREGRGGDNLSRIALFDLAVGALFHEAMKLRENFYQLAVYAPKVETARRAAAPGTEGLFEEFGHLLSVARERQRESIAEAEALLEQTRQQFVELLAEQRGDGLVARFLVENTAVAERVLGDALDTLFATLYGDAASGYAVTAHSYLESGHFELALGALTEAISRAPHRDGLHNHQAFAAGMSAYAHGRYEPAVAHLERWWMGPPVATEPFVRWAQVALERLPDFLAAGEDAIAERARELVRQLAKASGEPLLG